MIKLKIDAHLPFDNEIQFCDVCNGIAEKLKELGQQAIDDGDYSQFVGQVFRIRSANDDQEEVGILRVVGR